MNKNEMLFMFKKIKVKWPSFQLDPDLDFMAEVYLEDFAEFTVQQIDAAYRSLIGSGFAPTISEVLRVLADEGPMGEPWMDLSVNNPDRKPDFFSVYAEEKAAKEAALEAQAPEAV